ncbi:DNA-binding NarL/FixJ family response regulator [Streptomyces luteogriseus]|nr:DNA-binding NarL/FixJ family response regulator [Streptomyces luteogriseus]
MLFSAGEPRVCGVIPTTGPRPCWATFRILIDSWADMEVVAEAPDGAGAVALTRRFHPDIVLMDIRMPGTDGLTATSELCAARSCPPPAS